MCGCVVVASVGGGRQRRRRRRIHGGAPIDGWSEGRARGGEKTQQRHADSNGAIATATVHQPAERAARSVSQPVERKGSRSVVRIRCGPFEWYHVALHRRGMRVVCACVRAHRGATAGARQRQQQQQRSDPIRSIPAAVTRPAPPLPSPASSCHRFGSAQTTSPRRLAHPIPRTDAAAKGRRRRATSPTVGQQRRQPEEGQERRKQREQQRLVENETTGSTIEMAKG